MTWKHLPASALFAEFGFIVFYLLYSIDGNPWITIPGGVLLLVTLALMVKVSLRAARESDETS